MQSKVPLSLYADIVMGQSPKGDTCSDSVGMPLLNGPTEFGSKHPIPTQFTTDPKRQSKVNDILFCVRGSTTGRMNYADQEYAIGRGIASIRGKDGYPTVFVRGLIERNLQQLLNIATGSTFPNVGRDMINSFQVENVSKDDAPQIAHILSTLDDKIELNRKMNQTLEEMAQVLFKSWFVDFDPVHAKAECSSDEEMEAAAKELGISKEVLELFPSTLVESEMGMIPEGWEVKTLTDVVDFQNGYSFKSKELHDDKNNSTKVFKMGHIHRGGGFKEEGKDTYFYNADPEKMSKYLLEKGDVLMAMTDMKANMALLAHTALMPHTDRYLLNQRVGRLRVKDLQKLNYPYIYIFSNYTDTIHDLRSRSNSGVQVNLTTKAILDTAIIVPTQEIHSAFDSIVLTLFDKLFANNEEIVNLQKTRDTLLPKLLSGELDVSNINTQQSKEN